jgi:hypothetical protein
MFNAFDEIAIRLPNGCTLCCGEAISPMSGGACMGGDVRIRDPDGNEVVMWTSTEWEEDPEGVMGAIFGAAEKSLPELLQTLKRTRVEGGCWV